jgi:hypothetical protein
MYQPYPSKDQPSGQPGPLPPGPVRTAVVFMYAGAVVTVANAVLSIITAGSVQNAIRNAHPQFTSAQVHASAQGILIFSLVVAALEVFLWLFLARACLGGRNWGRITGTVLFGLNTVLILLSLALPAGTVTPRASVGILLTGLLWLAGLGAVVMLWRRESTAFFTASASKP